nr:SH3 domain-containing protein [Falsirhodobacter algicola]
MTGAAAAQDPAPDPSVGAVTNLPLPRYVTLKTSEGNARRGPGLTHRIDWVFTRNGMPLKITAEYGHWRRVEDSEGAGGWMHYALLSGTRSALVTADLAELHSRPNADSAVVLKAEKDVIGALQECNIDWCRLRIQGEEGWISKDDIWGVGADEVLD